MCSSSVQLQRFTVEFRDEPQEAFVWLTEEERKKALNL